MGRHPDRKYTYLITFNPAEAVKRNLDAYARQCETYGYECSPDQLGWALPIYVAETDEAANREAAHHIEVFFNKFINSPAEYKLPPGYSSMASYKYVMETKFKVREQFLSHEALTGNGMFVCGSPETVSGNPRPTLRRDGLRQPGLHATVRHPAGRADGEEHDPVRERGHAQAPPSRRGPDRRLGRSIGAPARRSGPPRLSIWPSA